MSTSICQLAIILKWWCDYADKWFVIIRDPNTVESVLRAEGKYPVCDNFFTQALNWLIKHRVKALPPMMFNDGEHWKRLGTAVGKQACPYLH